MTLWNKTKNSQVLSEMSQARSLRTRMLGLLGHAALSESEGLWIHRCNSIHTLGMRFAIDCIFIDSKLQVKKLVENVRPGRVVWPTWSASSVIEVASGVVKKRNIEIGDELDVGD